MFEELDDPTPDLRPAQTLPAVQARGRTLRRRRHLATAAGAGTAMAVVAAVVLALPSGVTSESLIATDPVPTPQPSAVTSPTVTPSPRPSLSPSPEATGATTAPPPSAPRSPATSAPATSAPATSAPATSAPATRVPSPAQTTPRSPGPVGSSTPGTPGSSVSASPPPTSEPTSDPAGGQVITLRGDDLAVTAVGAPRADAVAALTAVLGAPEADPATDVGCVNAVAEVAWPQFRVGFDAAGRVSGWSSTHPGITTPSGVAVGTTVARLQQVYGDRLTLSASDLEDGDTYTVEGVQMLGELSGTTPSSRVVALRNGDCIGP